jgi:hypothetical protein
MRSLLLRRPAFQIIALLSCLLIGATVGYIAGRHYQNLALAKCKEQNAVLTDDLTRAVKYGVILETNLILCKEHRDATH